MSNLKAEREAFEKEISGPPYEKSVLRYPNNHERCAWPGNYRDISVDLAWNIWQARAALQEAEPAAAEGQAGWRWVPVEPTKEMCIAAVKYANGDAVYKNVAAAALEIEEGIYGEAYAAMLAAAPLSSGQKEGEQP